MKLVMNVTHMSQPSPRELTSQEQEDLRYLFADALSDFIRPRQNADAYVADRYRDSGFSSKMLDDKRAQVQRRVALARSLHNTVLSLTCEPSTIAFKDLEWVEDEPGWLAFGVGMFTVMFVIVSLPILLFKD